MLFDDPAAREKFFVQIQGRRPSETPDPFVFRAYDFQFFLEENKVDNSYTEYKNRIGLTDGKRFLKDSRDVVLNFPFKDGILEGGQSTEEGQDVYFRKNKEGGIPREKSKRKEIFLMNS